MGVYPIIELMFASSETATHCNPKARQMADSCTLTLLTQTADCAERSGWVRYLELGTVRLWSASLNELDEASKLIHDEYIVSYHSGGRHIIKNSFLASSCSVLMRFQNPCCVNPKHRFDQGPSFHASFFRVMRQEFRRSSCTLN
jgi:hypothetical protein